MNPATGSGKSGSWPTPDPRVAFVLALGRALHTSGQPTPRIEEALQLVAERLGIPAQFFITPTSIFAAFGPEASQRTHLLRTVPSSANIGKLTRVDALMRRVLAGEMTPVEGLAGLDELERRPTVQHPILRVLGVALVSACAARFLDGGPKELAAAAISGLALGGIGLFAARNQGFERLYVPIGAFVAAVLVASSAWAFNGIAFALTMLAALVVLVPGMMLTTAMEELTTGHLASGTARLMGSVMVFMSIGFGVALGSQLVSLLAGVPPVLRAHPLPDWTEWVALLAASASFALLLRAESRDIIWITIAATLGFVASRWSGRVLGPELGMFAGAFVVGLGSNLFARFTNRPEAVTEVPGILILVPGSIGFRSITALLDNKVVSGVETAFKTLLIAVSLVAGLLMANLILPKPRRL